MGDSKSAGGGGGGSMVGFDKGDVTAKLGSEIVRKVPWRNKDMSRSAERDSGVAGDIVQTINTSGNKGTPISYKTKYAGSAIDPQGISGPGKGKSFVTTIKSGNATATIVSTQFKGSKEVHRGITITTGKGKGKKRYFSQTNPKPTGLGDKSSIIGDHFVNAM